MNPYREMSAAVSAASAPRRRRGRWGARRKLAGYLLGAIAARAIGFLWQDPRTLALCVALVIFGFANAMWGRSRTPLTRLCALLWNRGDRLGAVLLFSNLDTPRYSMKRVARNREELEWAQEGMPKIRMYNRFPFLDDD